MRSREINQSSSKRRGSLVGYFSFALSMLLTATVIYQKFLLDTSLHGVFENFPSTAAATIKTFLRSEAPSATTMSPSNNSSHKVIAADLGNEAENNTFSNENTSASSSILANSSTSTHTIHPAQDHTPYSRNHNLGHPSSTSTITPHSCLSKQESPSYQKPSPHKPSLYLLSQLRSYEHLHRQCGPYTTAYNRTTRLLLMMNNNSTKTEDDDDQCRYVIWTPTDGLGSQMISLTSTFLYALLTRRVLLVNFGSDISHLFCEPFPNSSWLLPRDFPHRKNRGFHGLKTLQTLINENNTSTPPSILHVDLRNHRVKTFHYDSVHTLIQKIPVLVFLSNLYYTPALFMTPSFMPEIHQLFPHKTLVFHHLGRYLFHPSNQAWTQIKDYYNSHLAHADVRLGLQIRVFWYEHVPHKVVMHQLLSCTKTHNLLPRPDHVLPEEEKLQSSKAVLVASLSQGYAKRLREAYDTEEDGEVRVRVFQVSSEGRRKFNSKKQNLMAWVEMYLLSLCDELVITGQSTFGYVAQGLGGLKPVVMRIGRKRYGTLDRRGGGDQCYKAGMTDPCLMVAARDYYKFDKWRRKVFPRGVQMCEDRLQGVRLG